MSAKPNTQHVQKTVLFVSTFWQNRKAELRGAESELWDVRDSLIDRRADSIDQKEQKELQGWIEQYAIAAEVVSEYAGLASKYQYPLVGV